MEHEFEIIEDIYDVEIIAIGSRIKDIQRLRRTYGNGRWRKLKGISSVRLPDGFVCKAELHWYEMTSAGRKEIKIKRLIF